MSGVLFKVDFEKAYDNMNWDFLYNVMLKKGFSHNCNDLVISIMTSGKVKINDQLGSYFATNRGVRQGNPLSLILFNTGVDSMSVMVKNA
jgi:hypothetical protein